MVEAAQNTETTESAVQDQASSPGDQVFTPQDMEGHDKIGEEGPAEVNLPPLFDEEETVSAEDLQGESDDQGDEAPKEDGEKASDPKKKAAPDQPKDDEKADSKEDKEPESDKKDASDAKPPAGMVPIGALHEERAKRQTLSSEIHTLKAQMAAMKAGLPEGADTDTGVPKDFKVLTDDEFSELADDDPGAAVVYQRHLQKHVEAKTAKALQEQSEQNTIDRSLEAMTKVVPGLFDENSDVNQQLTAFAVKAGLDDERVIGIVTDPKTRIVDENGNAQLLGEGAVKVLSLLSNLYQQSQGQDTDTLRKEIEKEVSAKLMKKFKAPGSTDGHASIADIPGSAGEELGREITEDNYHKFSRDDQRRWLGG